MCAKKSKNQWQKKARRQAKAQKKPQKKENRAGLNILITREVLEDLDGAEEYGGDDDPTEEDTSEEEEEEDEEEAEAPKREPKDDDEDKGGSAKPAQRTGSSHAGNKRKFEPDLSSTGPGSPFSRTKTSAQASRSGGASSGGTHHHWSGTRTASAMRIKEGHVFHCRMHDKYFVSFLGCKGCKRAEEDIVRRQIAVK